VRRRRIFTLAAVLCLCAATAAALLASDIRAWQSSLRASDAQAVADPSKALVRADEILPFHLARSLLGLDDDPALRRAFVLFRAGYTGIPSHDQSTAGAEARAQAEVALERVVSQEGNAPRAATAANLLGVLTLVDALSGASQVPTSVDRGIVEFQNAVRLDPGNDDAKANLELALGLAPPDSPFRTSRQASTGKRHGGASESSPGRGY
jgi:hypothetical protein